MAPIPFQLARNVSPNSIARGRSFAIFQNVERCETSRIDRRFAAEVEVCTMARPAMNRRRGKFKSVISTRLYWHQPPPLSAFRKHHPKKRSWSEFELLGSSKVPGAEHPVCNFVESQISGLS